MRPETALQKNLSETVQTPVFWVPENGGDVSLASFDVRYTVPELEVNFTL